MFHQSPFLNSVFSHNIWGFFDLNPVTRKNSGVIKNELVFRSVEKIRRI